MATDEQPLRVRAFALNLQRRPDRLASFQRAVPAEWRSVITYTTDWSGPVDGERIRDVSILRDAGVSVYDKWCLPTSTNRWWSREMKLGEIGCAYAHYRVWLAARDAFAADTELECVLVFEDDAYFCPDAVQRLRRAVRTELRSPWDLLYLGRVPAEAHKETKPSELCQLLQPAFSYCTYAYALSRSGVDKLLAQNFERALIPVDEFLPACYMPHPRPDLRALYAPTLCAWAFHEPVAFQRTKNEAGSDTEASAFFCL